MRRGIAVLGSAALLSAATPASADERTLALAVDGMSCASCPHIVKRALENTTGVIAADVLFREKRAWVTSDPSGIELTALINATSDIGYPSHRVGN